jgi:hypothetical protein
VIDQFDLAEMRQGIRSLPLSGFANPFRYAANRGTRVLPSFFAGQNFTDTISPGRYFPVQVGLTGGIVINTSIGHQNSLTFHNTRTAQTDLTLGIAGTNPFMLAVPNSTTPNSFRFVVGDRTGSDPPGGIGFFSGVQDGQSPLSAAKRPGIIVEDFQGISGTTGEITIYQFGPDFLQFTPGSANTHKTTIVAGGADTDISISLQPQGAGVIDFAYASNALGGGAAPTFGTIGGTGPTTAAQQDWLKITFNGTNTRWIPLWK